MMNATCGAKCYEQYKRLSPHGSLQKMSLVSQILMADWFSSRCALTWKIKGTKFNRLLFQLRPKTHRTAGIDAGLLPTPIAGNSRNGATSMENGRMQRKLKQGWTIDLHDLASTGMLPTPTAMDSTNATATMKSTQVKEGSMHSVTLNRAMAMGMLPTPMATDSPEKNTGTRKQDSIAKIAKEMTGTTSQLNPRFVAEMMGFPPNWTELPFQNGETSQSKDMEMP
jgi:hypothetical protein